MKSLIALALLAMSVLSLPAQAAESYDNCKGSILSLPATISTQGVWCLRGDLSTSAISGAAIYVNVSNVTIDCNDFKLGGLAAGPTSTTAGIRSGSGLNNITVRNCNVRGFYYGTDLYGSGHLVEESRFDNNLAVAIRVTGSNNRVIRNAVYDTGGCPTCNSGVAGIIVYGDAIENIVSAVVATVSSSHSNGVIINGDGVRAHGNLVRGLVAGAGGSVYGVNASGPRITIDGNVMAVVPNATGIGAFGFGSTTFCRNNTIGGFSQPLINCQPGTIDAAGNISHF